MKTAELPVTVTFRSAKKDHIPGVRTFYISSLSGGSDVYTLKVIRRGHQNRMTCSCPDFINRQSIKIRSCKHLTLLRDLIKRVGGVRNIPHGFEGSILKQTERNAVTGVKDPPPMENGE